MALHDQRYAKLLDENGFPHSLYWFNPRISNLHDRVVNFCGPICSTKWFEEAWKRAAEQ